MDEPSRAAAAAAASPGTVRRIYANLLRLLSGKAGAGILSLAYMAVAARALGPANYGVLVLVHGFAMTVGGIVEFPGWHAIVRYGAEAVEAGDLPRLARLLRFAALVEGAGGLLSVLCAAVLGPLFGARLGWSPEAVAFAVPYSFAVLASIRATPAGLLQLAGRFDLLGIHATLAPLTRLAGAAAAVLLHAGLHGFLVAWLAAALVEWGAMWALGLWVARPLLAGVPLSRGGVRGVTRENLGLWRFMVGANIDVTFAELGGRLAPLVIGWSAGPVVAGLYAVAQRATNVIAQPAQILGQAAYAELARLIAAGGRGAPLRAAVVRATLVALAAALPVLAALAVVGGRLMTLIGGPGFAAAAAVLLWLAGARAVLLVAPAASAALVALGRPALSVWANMGTTLLFLPLLPPLLARWGLVGAGVQALAQASACAALLALLLARESRDAPAPRAAHAV